MVYSKVHLIRSYCEIFFYHLPNIRCLKCTVNSNFHLIWSITLPMNDFELTIPDLYLFWSQSNLQGTCPRVRATFPEDGKCWPPCPTEQCMCKYGGRDLPSSWEVVLGNGLVPCEFRADWTKCLVFRGSWGCSSRVLPRMVPHPLLVALGHEIWHILFVPALHYISLVIKLYEAVAEYSFRY